MTEASISPRGDILFFGGDTAYPNWDADGGEPWASRDGAPDLRADRRPSSLRTVPAPGGTPRDRWWWGWIVAPCSSAGAVRSWGNHPASGGSR
jgi:hypothetical protein